MSESNTVIGINFGTAYTSIAYINKVKEAYYCHKNSPPLNNVFYRKVVLIVLPTKKVTDRSLLLLLSTVMKK